MLNLNQIQAQIKGPRLNPAHPTGEAFVMNDLYKALKSLGWTSLDKVHPTDRVSLFQLGSATIRRDKDQAPGHWIVEVAGGSYRTDADLETITAEAARFDAQAQELHPEPVEGPAASLAAQHAAILTTEYPELAGRIAKALALVEAGAVEFPKYGTTFDPATFYGCYSCDCPDSINRQPRGKFGIACKHALAMEINRRVQGEQKATAYRKLTDRLEADRARRQRDQALPADVGTGRSILDMLGYDDSLTVAQQKAKAAASLGSVLRPDYINRKASHSAQFRGIGHL